MDCKSPAAVARSLLFFLAGTRFADTCRQVFGGTGHMGRSLVKCALARGDLVCAVGRIFETSPESMTAQHPGPNSLGLLCDVRSRESVAAAIERTREQFGRLDVVANCSGYGVIGACEDQDEHEIRNQFETNFMGTLHIIQASLPYFRSQQAGRYLIFSSTSGALGVPGLGPYCATKYAVEGLIEAMLYEVDVFNIKATLVELGLARRDEPLDDIGPEEGNEGGGIGGDSNKTNTNSTTNKKNTSENTNATTTTITNTSTASTFTGGGPGGPSAGPGSTAGSSSSGGGPFNPLPTWGHFLIKPASAPYAHAAAPALHAKRMVQWLGDRQPTSAVKCAELVWQLGHCAYPPLRLVLGSYAIESIRDRLRSVTEELEDWKHLNFPASSGGGGGGGGDGAGGEGSASGGGPGGSIHVATGPSPSERERKASRATEYDVGDEDDEEEEDLAMS
jgi:NAD(P)-dependent dehydrogenase (short-subunit alcohol dehydrogenase family)